MGDRRGEYSGLVERPEGKNYLEDLGVDGRIISKWTTRNEMRGMDWIGLDWTGLDWTGLDWTGLD